MKRTTTLPYYQLDSGRFLNDSLGRTLEETGIYSMLLAIYWEHGCRLPAPEVLTRKLRLNKRQVTLMWPIIDEHFPDGINEHLDLCRDQAMNVSRTNSANARKGHEQRKAKEHEPQENPEAETVDDEF